MIDKIFLLGGRDLEMITIREQLDKSKIRYVDRNLDWSNAALSVYEDVLNEYADASRWLIYGIELADDVESPSNYVRIDHHNDYIDRHSSIEQVLSILNLAPDRHQMLVAANDAEYIPGMLALGASAEEIEAIRRADRNAQGVTEEDERLAESAIRDNKSGDPENLIVVKSNTSMFSPICDRLFPYKRLLVYTDDELMFYGLDSGKVRFFLNDGISQGKVFYGGGDSGYVGTVKGAYSSLEIESMVAVIENVTLNNDLMSKDVLEKTNAAETFSCHIFFFPFKWDANSKIDAPFSEKVNLNSLEVNSQSDWSRVTKPLTKDEEESLYNEKNYFYPFAHKVLYDFGSCESLVRHYERIEPKTSGNVFYYIKVKGRDVPYCLKVESINLNLYATGVGLLSFHLSNSDKSQSSQMDILRINQYGRRVMPPFFKDKELHNELSEWIKIEGLKPESVYEESFKDYKTGDFWKPAGFITRLISELSSDIVSEPVIDDRMFVMSWYKNDELANDFSNNQDVYCDSNSRFSSYWYRYLFVDGGDVGKETCQDDSMMAELLKKHTYLRWRKEKSLYGVGRYSFVYLVNSDVPDFLLNYFETIYVRMTELVILQRASLLRFSAEVSDLSSMNKGVAEMSERAGSLYKEYIHFLNQVNFREVSAQDQGIEIYGMLRSSLKLDEHIADLDSEIGKLHQYVQMMEERESNSKATVLNNMAAILLPVSIVTGFWGMNAICDVASKKGFVWQIIMVLLGIAIVIVLVVRKKKK